MTIRDPVTPMVAAPLDYRPCVGIALFNLRGEVFIGQRKVGEEGGGHGWQMPQGGIDPGEDPLVAARRELYEETGIRAVSFLMESPDWLRYDLPGELVGRAWRGRYRGQTQKWFAFRFEGSDGEIDVRHPPDGHKAEFVDWRWESLDRTPDLVIPFKREVYVRVVETFRHLSRTPDPAG